MSVIVADDAKIHSTLTAWDALVMGYRTNAMTQIPAHPQAFAAALDLFEQQCTDAWDVRFTTVRLPATLRTHRAVLEYAGYYLVGVYPTVHRARTLGPLPVPDTDCTFRDATDADIPALDQLAATFTFGPFFDDPRIEDRVARDRMQNRIPQLLRDMPVRVAVRDDRIVGFLASQEEDGETNLVLGGVLPGERGVGRPLWTETINAAVAREQDTHAVIAATNLAVTNLYRKLGFSHQSCDLGFHKCR